MWHVIALTAGALPGAVLLSIGGRALLSVLGIGLGFAGVFFFTMAALTALPLVALCSRPTGVRACRPSPFRWA